MKIYHMSEVSELTPPAVNALIYGRYLASVRDDGKVALDNHLLSIDSDDPPSPGEKVMICCNHDYYCSRVTDYEKTSRH